jgi:hypothetical protein
MAQSAAKQLAARKISIHSKGGCTPASAKYFEKRRLATIAGGSTAKNFLNPRHWRKENRRQKDPNTYLNVFRILW